MDKGVRRETMEKNGKRPRKLSAVLSYKLYSLAHVLLFNDKSILVRAFRPVARYIDSRRRLKKVWDFSESLAKKQLFECMNCGDCGLPDVAYICPMSQCPKNQRNGPCGGSRNDWCEGYPNERKCVWVRAYERLEGSGRVGEIGARIILPQDWRLWQTPSWLNFVLGRDHNAKRSWIEIRK